MADSTRIELKIDVFEKPNQVAKALPQITAVELIQSILEEFTSDLDYLGQNSKDYALEKITTQAKLEGKVALSQQVSMGDHLVLVENEPTLPAHSRKPTHPLYLQNADDLKSVYKLSWLPAIIGRHDASLASNELVAVNLETTAAGLRVSRRHAQITEEQNGYYIQNLSSNPTFIIKSDKPVVEVTIQQKQPLQHGDIIHLERSSIKLRFIVRQTA